MYILTAVLRRGGTERLFPFFLSFFFSFLCLFVFFFFCYLHFLVLFLFFLVYPHFFPSAFYYPHFSIRIRHPQVSGPHFTDTL